MHTIFINTSKREFDFDIDILDMQREVDKFVDYHCCSCGWGVSDDYVKCADNISALIDNNKALSHKYNLIAYSDLMDYDVYADIVQDRKKSVQDKSAAVELLEGAICALYKNTLYKQLSEHYSSTPNEFLIVFEHNGVYKTNANKLESDAMENGTLELLGFPCKEDIKNLVAGLEEKNEKIKLDELKDAFKSKARNPWIKGIEVVFEKEIEILLNSIVDHKNIDKACSELVEAIKKTFEENRCEICKTDWVTNRSSLNDSLRIHSRHALELQLFLLECSASESVITNKNALESGETNVPEAKEFKKFDDDKWDELIGWLQARFKFYTELSRDAEEMSTKFEDKKMIPQLHQFHHEKFGMDEFGCRDTELVIVDAEEKDEDKKDNKKENNKEGKEETEQDAIISDISKESYIEKKKIAPILDESEFPAFKYTGDDFEGAPKGKEVAEYLKQATELRRHHLNYLKKLKVHVVNGLANYAGKSLSNDPPVLTKRKVGAIEEDVESPKIDHRYGKPGKDLEKTKPELLVDKSNNAYDTSYSDFMEFSAGRSVAVTDIQEQYDWFVTRIYQIEESLKKIKTTVFGLFFALLALYIPFVLIQWDEITKNVLTIVIALCSILIPLATLGVAFVAAYIRQRRMFRKAWNEFKQKSDEALASNADTARKYDQLLNTYVPSLRWVYEYKIDVEFAAECSKMASAKLNHHRQMLKSRITTVGNLLENIGEAYGDVKQESAHPDWKKEVDYTNPFSVGKNNIEIYSIVDSAILKEILK